jgi:site-specific recombinase XerD
VNAITLVNEAARTAALALPPLVPASTWREVLETYSDVKLTASPNTRRAYRRAIVACFEALGVDTLAELSGRELAAYRARLVSDGRAPGSQAVDLAAVRSFLKWARRFGACNLPADVIGEALESEHVTVVRPFQILTDPELGAVLAAAKTARDRALLAVMAGCGLRVSEAVGLDVGDVRENGDGAGVLHVRHGKGGKDRLVPVGSDVLELIKVALAETGRMLGESGPLFRAHDRGATRRVRSRLTSCSAGVVVREAVRAAGVVGKAISPHSLRHGFAVRCLRAGASVVAVSTILGHADVSTTGRYLKHLELAELAASVPALP